MLIIRDLWASRRDGSVFSSGERVGSWWGDGDGSFLLGSDIDPVDFDLTRSHAFDPRMEEEANRFLSSNEEVFGCFHESYKGTEQRQYDPAEDQ